jgi:hypothetical protein
MDSESDKEKYYASEDTEDDKTRAYLRDGLQYHSLLAQIFPPAALKLRMMLVMWRVNNLWTLRLEPHRRVVHTFIGAPPTGKAGTLHT